MGVFYPFVQTLWQTADSPVAVSAAVFGNKIVLCALIPEWLLTHLFTHIWYKTYSLIYGKHLQFSIFSIGCKHHCYQLFNTYVISKKRVLWLLCNCRLLPILTYHKTIVNIIHFNLITNLYLFLIFCSLIKWL